MKSRVAQKPSIRQLGFLLPLVLAMACSGASARSASSSTGEPSPTGAPIHRAFLGAGTHPTVTVEAPSSAWTPFKQFGVTSDCCGVAFWDAGDVARNPCHSIGHLFDPGPTVDDLVAALEAQPLRHASAPTDVTLAGYAGKYLEWSVPKDWVVTGDGDFAGCDVQPNGHRDFVSWLGAGGVGERWQQMAGQVDRLWILDVNGQRLVVDASYSPDTTQAQLDLEDQIIQSIEFVPTS
jgi:hypothetical protein